MLTNSYQQIKRCTLMPRKQPASQGLACGKTPTPCLHGFGGIQRLNRFSPRRPGARHDAQSVGEVFKFAKPAHPLSTLNSRFTGFKSMHSFNSSTACAAFGSFGTRGSSSMKATPSFSLRSRGSALLLCPFGLGLALSTGDSPACCSKNKVV